MGPLEVLQQFLIRGTELGTEGALGAGLALNLLCLDALTPAVQHLDLPALQLLPKIILRVRFLRFQLLLQVI